MAEKGRWTPRWIGIFVIAFALYLSAPGAKSGARQSEPGPPASGSSAQGPGQRWWRLVPQELPPEPASTSRKQLLAKRGAYFDAAVGGSPWPLDQPPKGWGTSIYTDEICEGGDNPPFFPNEAVVVATFKSYQVYLSPSHRSLYTSLKLDVEHVLEPGPSAVKAGQVIDQLLSGGTARLANGRVLSYGLTGGSANKNLEEKPGHRYLLFLRYVSDGNFFVEEGVWELRGRRAVPTSLCYAAAAREGKAHYAGMSEADFLAAMREAIQKHREALPKQ